jgi:hypothetical protein
MKYYTTTTEYNCGIDLHARQMYVCVMDRPGKKLVHTNVKDNDFDYFLKLVQPYRHDLTVCCECIFGWPVSFVRKRAEPVRAGGGPTLGC